MLELVNLSNIFYDTEHLLSQPDSLTRLLKKHGLAGIELMLYEPWNSVHHPKEKIKGVHLKFWPSWVDFWENNTAALQNEFSNQQELTRCFEADSPKDWLEVYRQNIREAVETEAEYVVFHVAQSRSCELSTRQYFYKDDDVITATIEVVNEITNVMPENMRLLFENLWWPGMTLLDKKMVEKLFSGVRHKNSGIMLDAGHLMNTELNLRSEQAAVEYVIQTVNRLGEFKQLIKGMHLHKSLSGEFVAANLQNSSWSASSEKMMEYALKVDQHKPFETEAVQRLVQEIAPDYLVHEFIQESYQDWSDKLTVQRHALGWE